MSSPQSIVIIPARYDSTRFPGKPLALINGISMIERVWRIALRCKQANKVFVATDSEKIAAHVQAFGANVIMTSADCETGTDRVAEAAAQFANEDDILVSLQGDAVLTPPWVIDEMLSVMKENSTISMSTPAVKLMGQALVDFMNHKKISPSSGTTVVLDKEGKALYFSKQPIPYQYDLNAPNASMLRHIGLYAYRFKTLKQLQSLASTPLERQEKLEQLRALENGIDICVVMVDYQGRTHGSVDTPHDIKMVESIIEKEGELVA